MAVELIGAAGMTNELMQTYDKRLLSRALTNTLFYQYAPMKKPIPPRGGKSIQFRRFEKLDVTAGSYTLTEGTMPSEIQATVSAVSGTVSQYGQFLKASDLLETQAFDPVIAEFVDLCGDAMGRGVDIVIRNALSSATTIQYAGAATRVGTSGAGAVGSGLYVNAAELREMYRTLRRAGARPFGNYYRVMVHPDNKKDLFEDPEISETFKDALAPGDSNPLISGMLGRWEGWEFIENNNLRIYSSYGMSGADIYEIVCFGQEFYGVTELSAMQAKTIVHPRGTGGHTDPLDQYSTIGWKAALCGIILNNDFGGIIYVASSRSNSA